MHAARRRVPARAAAGSDPAISGGQVGISGVRDRHRRGAQCPLRVGIVRVGAPRLDLAGGFVASRSGTRLSRKMLGGWEFGHVGAGFGDHHLSGESADARNGTDQIAEAAKGSITT